MGDDERRSVRPQSVPFSCRIWGCWLRAVRVEWPRSRDTFLLHRVLRRLTGRFRGLLGDHGVNHRGRVTWVLATMTAVVFAVAACSSGSGDETVSVARARGPAKEAALTTAQAEAKAASAAFCGATQAYITAVDRYGDVLNATAPTGGDVTGA